MTFRARTRNTVRWLRFWTGVVAAGLGIGLVSDSAGPRGVAYLAGWGVIACLLSLGIEAYRALCRIDTGEAYITVRPSNEEET